MRNWRQFEPNNGPREQHRNEDIAQQVAGNVGVDLSFSDARLALRDGGGVSNAAEEALQRPGVIRDVEGISQHFVQRLDFSRRLLVETWIPFLAGDP